MKTHIEMTIHKLELNLLLSKPTVVLKENTSDRKLAIFTDLDHIDLLNKCVEGSSLPFCSSMQTTMEIIPALGGHLIAIEISRQDENGCYSDLVIRNHKNEEVRLSSPTGFALAMAHYSGVPIMVSTELFKTPKVSEISENDIDELVENMNREILFIMKGHENLKYKM